MYRLLLLFNLCLCVYGLIGFDCGGRHLNITSVSLLGVGDCHLRQQTPNSTSTYIQLLQLSEYNYAEVIQCKVEVSRTIQHCGMHSHISTVHGARMEYLMDIEHSKCKLAFQEGVFSMGPSGILTGLKANATMARSIVLAGSVKHDGTCEGTQYSDPYGTWSDVVVDAVVRVTLKSSYVPVHLDSGRIMLRSGTVCLLRDGFCIDSDDGHTFWKPTPTTSCNFQQYDVLYEGKATKMTSDASIASSPVVYTLTTQDITFGLTATREQPLCGYTLLRTEHPKLFILETTKGDSFAHQGSIPVDHLDIFTYVNSKFVYVEKHIRHQMTSLYHNVIQQKCELEREVLKNTLSFATIQPDEFAYRLMKGPGYMAVTSGEVIHVIKCIPVDVIVRRTKDCYSELPVTVRNASLFITPKSRILTKTGTLRECSHELPTLYRIEDTWVQFTPEPHVKEAAPQQLRPMTTLSWKYLTPGPLASSGIYSQADIDKLKDHIMFPVEKPALLNTMARGITGHTVQDGSVSIYNLLDEASLKKIADNTASRIWGGFITFGSATAGIMGVLIVIRLIKLTVDTMIHGYALHSAYGCSLYVLGAVWSSLTHLLLYLARGIPRRNDNPEDPGSSPLNDGTPSAPRTEDNAQAGAITDKSVNTAPTPKLYKNLQERLHNLENSEQLPLNTSEIVLK